MHGFFKWHRSSGTVWYLSCGSKERFTIHDFFMRYRYRTVHPAPFCTLGKIVKVDTSTLRRAAKADQHGQQECHACLHVHTKVTFLGDFFSVYKKCVRQEKLSNRVLQELFINFYYILTLIRESQYLLP